MENREEKGLVPVRENATAGNRNHSSDVGQKNGKELEKTGYWSRIAGAYTFVFRALLFVLPLFVIVFMAICAQAFTRNSVFGFGNDLLSVSSFLSSDYKTVYYTYEEGEQTVLCYRDGVAVVTIDGVEVYSPDGERLLEHTAKLTTPRAAVSAKYLVVYDFGTTFFAVTNGYSVLFEGKTEFPILGATVADTGHFALITASDTHLSQVLLYDANFNLTQRFSRGSATTDVCLSSNGKYVAFSGITSENGVSKSVVELYRIGTKLPTFSVQFDEMALSLSFTDTRHLALITQAAGYVLDLDADVQSRMDFDGASLVAFDVNENGCAFLLNTQGIHAQSRILVCDSSGDSLFEKRLERDLGAVSLAPEHVYLLDSDSLLRVSLEKDRTDTLAVSPGAQGILLTAEEQLRLVYTGAAEYVEFD